MSRFNSSRSNKEFRRGVGRQVGRSVLTFLFTNPIGIILIVLVVAMIAYTLYSMDYQLKQILKQYTSLSARTTDSRAGFDRRLFYITTDSNGNQVVHVGYSSEVQEEAAQFELAGVAGWNGTWSGSGLQARAMDFYSSYSYTGKGSSTNISVNDVKLYNGIPWSDDGNWYELNIDSVNSYLTSNIGKPLQGASSFHADDYNEKTAKHMNGVPCARISWMPIFCFCDVDESGGFSPAYTTSLCNQDSRYGVVVLEKNGERFYLPVCSGGDNKGHTWPGGIVQTYIGNGTRYDSSTGKIVISSGGALDQKAVTWGGVKAHGMTMTMSEFVSGWAGNVKYNGGGMNAHPSLTVELPTVYKNALTGYKIVGFIMHK